MIPSLLTWLGCASGPTGSTEALPPAASAPSLEERPDGGNIPTPSPTPSSGAPVGPQCPAAPALPSPWAAATLKDYVPVALEVMRDHDELGCPTVEIARWGGSRAIVSLGVNSETRESALWLALDGRKPTILATYGVVAPEPLGTIATPIRKKDAGEAFGSEWGVSRLSGEPLSAPDLRSAEASVGVVACTMTRSLQARPELLSEASAICYCETMYWSDEAGPHTAITCD